MNICNTFSDSDPGSRSLDFEEALVSMRGSQVSTKVLCYKKILVTLSDIEKLREKRCIYSTDSGEDVILEVCEKGETVGFLPSQEVEDDLFYFYCCPLDDFKIRFPFSDFIADLLTTLNVALTQLHPNRWGFIQAFEFVCEALDIDPSLASSSLFSN